ncbi:MAG TPA: hypothetical protein VLX44_05240 [Xanthobacteraceae bacterium]|nr:hypothetical protein [Xanthobacteraceae bacterium]
MPLGIALLATIAIFFISNVVFVTGCTLTGRAHGVDACRISSGVESLGHTIPSIDQVASWYDRSGMLLDAQLVRSALSFIWASAIAAVVLMISAACLTPVLLSADSKRAMRAYCEQRSRSRSREKAGQINKTVALFLIVAIGGFQIAYWGDSIGMFSPRAMASSGIFGLCELSGFLAVCLFVFFPPMLWTARALVVKTLSA